MAKIGEYIKTFFFILLFLQFAPPVLKNIKKQWIDSLEPKNHVGLIHINQPIFTSSEYSKQLNKFFKDSDIKAILLKIDCEGGAAGTSQALAQEVLQLKKQYPKPIVAYSENMCASGAYYIAAMTDHIVTTGCCIVGSIGTKVATQFKLKELLESLKIQTHSFASGSYKNTFDQFTDLTEEQKQMIQELSDDNYVQFTTDISKQRHLPLQQKNNWANGRVFTGKEALKQKLIDAVGNMTTATDYIKQNILHSDREIEFVKAPRKSNLEQWLGTQDNDDDVQFSVAESLFSGLFKALKKEA